MEQVTCPKCNGSGKVTSYRGKPAICPRCAGTGKVYK
jgi:DnaJ-class molecular chaperone